MSQSSPEKSLGREAGREGRREGWRREIEILRGWRP